MSAMQPATPQELEVEAAPGGRKAVLGRFDLSSAIYGSLLITALVAAQSRHDANPEFIGFSVLVSVIVFWLMEVWSGLVSLRVQGPITMAETREVALHESPMLAAAILPLLALGDVAPADRRRRPGHRARADRERRAAVPVGPGRRASHRQGLAGRARRGDRRLPARPGHRPAQGDRDPLTTTAPTSSGMEKRRSAGRGYRGPMDLGPVTSDPMSLATSTDTRSPALHAADNHDLIRVQGARVNNLKDVSIEIPKRRLTVFTGVSGSGKSSLVFDTIAAESRRLIDETYSTFVQVFMPTLARPDVDVLEGLTTAILVDQERLGANPRSTLGTVTDANAMLRSLFSRLGKPYIGGPTAFSFNIPTTRASGVMTGPKGEKKIVQDAVYLGGMCAECEGRGTVSDLDLSVIIDESKSLLEGAILVPGYTADGWMVTQFAESGFFDPNKPIKDYTEKERHDLLYRQTTKVKARGINITYDGLIPKIRKSMFSKDVDSLQPHIRAFVERAAVFKTCPVCDGSRLNDAARSSKIKGLSIADVCALQVTDAAAWLRGIDDTGRGAAGRQPAAPLRLVRRDRPGLPLARPSLGHAVRAARRSAPRWSGTSGPR